MGEAEEAAGEGVAAEQPPGEPAVGRCASRPGVARPAPPFRAGWLRGGAMPRTRPESVEVCLGEVQVPALPHAIWGVALPRGRRCHQRE